MSITQALRAELTEHLIPFWKGMLDTEFGGFYGRMRFDLQIDKHADKSCILCSRILWFFSKAAVFLKDDSLLPYAKAAYDFLTKHFVDTRSGGVFWSATYDGTPKDRTKHTYNQAFAIYALSAYAGAMESEEALRIAGALFDVIETRCTDEGGYLEAFAEDFSPIANDKLSENGVIAERTMNTLLHVFEGYAGLYEASGDARVADAMRRILERYEAHIYSKAKHRQEVFFDRQYQPLLDLHSYGHDIESAWLIAWGAELLRDECVNARLRPILDDLAETVLKMAFHDGAVWNEREQGREDKTRIWWVQAEAMVGFCDAWQRSPQRQDYYDAMSDIWAYTKTHLIDARPGGEWFWDVDPGGMPSSSKDIVEPWKCPYHNGRMCMEIIRRLEA